MRKRLNQDIDSVQNENEKQLYRDQDERYGVLSMSKRWDSILMWSHYSCNHKGFCVGFIEEKIRNSHKFAKGGMVTYSKTKEYPVITPLNEQSELEKAFTETHSKAEEWSYEEEYRLTRVFFPVTPTVADRTIQFEDDFFAEIILGIQISKQDKVEIIEIAKRKKIPVYQAKKKDYKFLIDRVQIA